MRFFRASTTSWLGRARSEDARLEDARLTVVCQCAEFQTFDNGGDVCVVKQDGCRLAAELKTYTLELLSSDRTDPAASTCRARERDLVYVGVRNEVLARFTIGGQDAQAPSGNPDSWKRSAKSIMLREFSGDTSRTTVLPARSAGTILAVAAENGEFHGMTAAMTPMASRRTMVSKCTVRSEGSIVFSQSSASAALRYATTCRVRMAAPSL